MEDVFNVFCEDCGQGIKWCICQGVYIEEEDEIDNRPRFDGSERDLRREDLTNVSLRKSHLYKANLSGKSLVGLDFSGSFIGGQS